MTLLAGLNVSGLSSGTLCLLTHLLIALPQQPRHAATNETMRKPISLRGMHTDCLGTSCQITFSCALHSPVMSCSNTCTETSVSHTRGIAFSIFRLFVSVTVNKSLLLFSVDFKRQQKCFTRKSDHTAVTPGGGGRVQAGTDSAQRRD